MTNPAQVRKSIREQAERKAAAGALIDYFAQHHPELLVKIRAECLESAIKRGLSDDAATDDARRHLIAHLRFLKNEGVS